MSADADPRQPAGLIPPSAPSDTIARAPILIYKTLISFLKAACSSMVANRSEIVRLQRILNGHELAMTSVDVVGIVMKSLQNRKTLLELAAELSLTDEPNLRHALRADEAELVALVISILHSKDAEKAILSLEGDAAQCFIDVVQDILDRGFLMERGHSKKAHRVIRKLSELCDKLPSSLFVTGVSGSQEHPTFRGGFGDVYCASHGGKTVALKVMRHFSGGSDSRDFRLKICREALVWRDLHHPHILPFLGIDRDTFPTSLAMVSPWMEHGTVLNYLDRHGRANVDKLLYQIALGIEYLHSRKIVHGDLRGANILVKDDWTTCLADFGLSAFSDSASTTRSTQRAGSIYWMAPELIDPEQFGCKFARTPATDVYAFGCICVELYTGRAPLSELREVPAMFRIINGERAQRPMGPPAMSDTLWQNITDYWAADPAARPSSEIVAQRMLWLAFEGDDPDVDRETMAPALEINTEGSQDNPNEVRETEEEELTLKGIIPLLKHANINGNPDKLAQDSMLPQQSQFQIEDNGPSHAQEDATADLKKAIQDESPTQTLLSFVEKGADINIRAEIGAGEFLTALQLGILRGDKEFIAALLAHGADPNIQGSGGNPLQLASKKGELEITKLLLDHGANINFDDNRTALVVASEHGKLEIVKLLLSHGADVNSRDGYYSTALQAASAWTLPVAPSNKKLEIAKLLLSHGADVNSIGGNFGTALQAASMYGAMEIIKPEHFLHNDVDGIGGTALQPTFVCGGFEIFKLLLSRGANVNIIGGAYGTALQAGSVYGASEVVKLLLESGADVNIQGGPYNTALIGACSNGNLEIVKILLESGADVHIQGGGPDHTALIAACLHGNLEIVKLLLDHHPSVNIQGVTFTALHYASRHCNLEMVKLLIDHGAELNINGPGFGTPLHQASEKGGLEVVKLLIEHGADPNMKTYYGTAMQCAERKGQMEVVAFLKEHSANMDGGE